ncbi:MAG: glycosyltransferase family 4 protein [Pseudomonadota bacterium]|nr:glycosyltransferase family 4 protein [Pseudomonadota bacterium]
MIRALLDQGHSVLAAAPGMDEATADWLRAHGAQPLTLQLSNASLNPMSMLTSFRQLRRLLAEHRPDVLISYTIKPVIVGAHAGHAAGVQNVVSLITGVGFALTEAPGNARRRLVRWAASLLYRSALRRSHFVLFQNRDDQALFRELRLLGPDQPSTVVDGSGVDIDFFSPAPLPHQPSFLMISRLLWDKGIREFAQAARRLRREHPQVPVALVGYLDPSPDSLTQRELDELIACGIHFYGKLDDVRPAIAEASIYVLPSYREGTPRSVLEAMAMARPVITTDAPGCRETVVEGLNGLLVPPRDADALYAAMVRFIEHPEMIGPMGAESRKLAERKYDARKVSADVLRAIGLGGGD